MPASTCKECRLPTDINKYGYCKRCIEERTKRVINSKRQSEDKTKKVEGQKEKQNSLSSPFAARPNSSETDLEKEWESKTAVENDRMVKTDSHAIPLDPLKLLQNNGEDKPNFVAKSVWKQGVSGREYTSWHELSSKLHSQIQREDGFAVTIDGVVYTYRNLNGGMVYRSGGLGVRGLQERNGFENEVNDEQSRRKRNTVSLVRNDGTSAEIFVRYGTNRVAQVRHMTREKLEEEEQSSIVEKLFSLGKESKNIEFKPVRVKQEKAEVSENVLLFQIYARHGRKFTRTISGGNYDFVGGSDAGYLITLSSEADDDYLLKTAVSVVRKLGFACYPSNFSAYCFLSDNTPTIVGQRELLTTICNRIMSEVMQYDA